MPDLKLPPGGWVGAQALVLEYLQRHGEMLERLDDKLDTVLQRDIPEMRVELASLKIKAGMWAAFTGTLAGMVPVSVMMLMKTLFGAHK